MRVLITGGTGFLGRWAARAFVRANHEVRLLVRSRARLGTLEGARCEVVEGDILSRESLARATRGVNAIVHCAACVSLKPRDRARIHRTNVVGTKNVLDAAAARHLRVLHTSSIATVGPSSLPVILDETAAASSLDFAYPYADSKRVSESLALAYARAGQDVVVLNPGILLGPDDPYFSSTEFVLRYLRSELGVHLPGGGSFCHVRDVAQAYPRALVSGRRGERYILAGINRSYGQVMAELRKLTGLQRSTHVPRAIAEWAGLYSELGAALGPHPLEKFNRSVARWGSLYNFCDAGKAEAELGYRNRDFTATLTETVVDLLRRGAARPSTPELCALLAHAPQLAPSTHRQRKKSAST